MREQKVFICEFCGAQYENEQEALDCEKYHRKPKKIKQSYYNEKNTSDGYPNFIRITFDDELSILYKKYRE